MATLVLPAYVLGVRDIGWSYEETEWESMHIKS